MQINIEKRHLVIFGLIFGGVLAIISGILVYGAWTAPAAYHDASSIKVVYESTDTTLQDAVDKLYTKAGTGGSVQDVVWFGNIGLLLKDGANAFARCTVENSGSGVYTYASGYAKKEGGKIYTKATVSVEQTGYIYPTGGCDSGWIEGTKAFCSIQMPTNLRSSNATVYASGVSITGTGLSNCASIGSWKS